MQESWLGVSSDNISSFEEICCVVFDDYNIEVVINESKNLSNIELTLLKSFRDALNECCNLFAEHSLPKNILNSKEWKKVEQAAINLREYWVKKDKKPHKS